MRMQENPSNHIRIPNKILRRGLPAPLNIPNQTNSRPCRAVWTTSVFSFLGGHNVALDGVVAGGYGEEGYEG